MNPLDWRGPEFLVFYIVFAAVVIAALYYRRRGLEEDDTSPDARPTDPYEIAYLRGGANEVIRVASLSLIGRGLLEVKDGTDLVNRDPAKTRGHTHRLEAALLRFFETRAPAADAFKNGSLVGSTGKYRERLEDTGMLPNEAQRARRLWLVMGGWIVLWGAAAVKIALALSRGHTNIFYLILAAGIAGWGVWLAVYTPHRTVRGDNVLDNLRTLFNGLQMRPAATFYSPASGEVLMLSAVFGMAAVPETVFPHRKTLYARASSDSSGGCGSSCGSSCGGGGCGGGGCGGCGS